MSGSAAGEPGGAGAGPRGERPEEGSWLWAHIGRISGLVLAVLTLAGLVLLAVAGFTPAYLLIVLLLGGVTMIAVGGRLRGT